MACPAKNYKGFGLEVNMIHDGDGGAYVLSIFSCQGAN